jgi:hypothetical protein
MHVGLAGPLYFPPPSYLKHSIMKSTLARINYLNILCKALPTSLPLNPSRSTYNFIPDAEISQEEPWQALNKCLEVAFWTWETPKPQMAFIERGERLVQLIQTLQHGVHSMPSEHQFLCDIWVEPLIQCAIRSGTMALVQDESPQAQSL